MGVELKHQHVIVMLPMLLPKHVLKKVHERLMIPSSSFFFSHIVVLAFSFDSVIYTL
jgi:hypothetical protein